MFKVLVTGGAGFIGSHTVEVLLTNGATVRVLDNLSSGSLKNLPLGNSNLEFIDADIRDAAAVAQAFVSVTHCLHLAAQVSAKKSLEAPVDSANQNITGFITLLEEARKAGVQRFVYASSAAVYGMPVTLPLCETASLCPLSPYGLEKQVNEQYAQLYSKVYGFSSLGLRYFNVYGPGQDAASPYAGVITRFVEAIKHSEPLTVYGDGQQTRDFIYVTDVAQANMAALVSERSGVINVASGSTTSLLQLINYLEELSNIDSRKIFIDSRPGDIRDSAAKLDLMVKNLNFKPAILLQDGLKRLLYS